MTLWQKIKYYYAKRRRVRMLDSMSKVSQTIDISRKELSFPIYNEPLVTIIVSLHDDYKYTLKCLASILDSEPGVGFEVILINHAQKDISPLSIIKNISIINNENNANPVKSINSGIEKSKGSFICLLNNNTTVKKGFIDELLYVFKNFTNVGAVAPKIVDENGSLQEAGSYLLKNEKMIPFVLNGKPYFPEVNFIYRVDYSSKGCLLFNKWNDDNTLCLLDDQYSLASTAVVDLCLLFRKKQKEIYYTPFSEAIHYTNANNEKRNEGSIKSDESFKKNFTYLTSKWNSQLSSIKAESIQQRRLNLYNNKSIVFFNVDVPTYNKDSGSNRIKEIMLGYQSKGYLVVQISSRNKITNHYNQYYQKKGICVYYEHLITGSNDRWPFFKRMQLQNVLIWLTGPQVFVRNYKKLYGLKRINKKVIYDMVDVHHLRLKRAMELEPSNKQFQKQYKTFLRWEMTAAQFSDLIIAISKTEAEYVAQFSGKTNVVVVSNVHDEKESGALTAFEDRRNILFIGSTHTPNIDAVYYLYNEIMPIVWSKNPNIVVSIIGSVKEEVENINDDRFIFKGFVPDIEPLFNSSKLMVAPLRYGAGVKGKIGQAFEYKLPVVTTDIGAEGILGVEHNKNILLANNATEFATMILALYTNPLVWEKLRNGMGDILKQYSSEIMYGGLKEIEDRLCNSWPQHQSKVSS